MQPVAAWPGLITLIQGAGWRGRIKRGSSRGRVFLTRSIIKVLITCKEALALVADVLNSEIQHAVLPLSGLEKTGCPGFVYPALVYSKMKVQMVVLRVSLTVVLKHL